MKRRWVTTLHPNGAFTIHVPSYVARCTVCLHVKYDPLLEKCPDCSNCLGTELDPIPWTELEG